MCSIKMVDLLGGAKHEWKNGKFHVQEFSKLQK